MKPNELRQKSIDEIKEALSKVKKELEKNTSDILLKKEKNAKKTFFLRKDIARLRTVLKEKEILK